jgi:endoglucanase
VKKGEYAVKLFQRLIPMVLLAFIAACSSVPVPTGDTAPHEAVMAQAAPAGALLRTGWSIQYGTNAASKDSFSVILDGNERTVWTSVDNQNREMAIRFDLGAVRTFDKLVLEAGVASPNYLRSYNIYLSNDPNNWYPRVKIGDNVTKTRLEINLGQQSGRYLTIQNGYNANSGTPWSIAEMWLVDSSKVTTPSGFSVTRAINAEVKVDDRQNGLPLSSTEIKKFKTAGLDTVRLMTDPTVYMQVDGSFSPNANPSRNAPALKDAMDNALGAGLRVVVDVHTYVEFPGLKTKFNDVVLCGSTENKRKFDRFLETLARYLATTYTDKSKVALELLNEPNDNGCPTLASSYPTRLTEMYKAARRGSSNLMLVLSPLGNSSIFELKNIKPFADINTIYTIHYYTSLTFTHQAARFTERKFAFMSGITYPARPQDFNPAWSRALARINAAPVTAPRSDGYQYPETVLNEADRAAMRTLVEKELRCYFEGNKNNTRPGCYYPNPYSRGDTDYAFSEAATWAATNKIAPSRIWLGEFGVLSWDQRVVGEPRYEGAPDADRALWIKDVREVAQSKGFGWAYFVHCCGGYSITTNHTYLGQPLAPWDRRIVEALGLKQPEIIP